MVSRYLAKLYAVSALLCKGASALLDDLKISFDKIIDTLGTKVRWAKTAEPFTVIDMRVGMRTAGKGDTELIQTYGIDTRIFTAKIASFAGSVPEEFDRLTVNVTSNVYTINGVHEIWLNDEIIGYKMLCKANR